MIAAAEETAMAFDSLRRAYSSKTDSVKALDAVSIKVKRGGIPYKLKVILNTSSRTVVWSWRRRSSGQLLK